MNVAKIHLIQCLSRVAGLDYGHGVRLSSAVGTAAAQGNRVTFLWDFGHIFPTSKPIFDQHHHYSPLGYMHHLQP